MDYIQEHINANYFIEVTYKNDKLKVRFPKSRTEKADCYSYMYDNGEMIKQGFKSLVKIKSPKKLLPTFVINDISRESKFRDISIKLLTVYNGYDYKSLKPSEFTKIVNLLISKEEELVSSKIAEAAIEYLRSNGEHQPSIKELEDCKDTFYHIMNGNYFDE